MGQPLPPNRPGSDERGCLISPAPTTPPPEGGAPPVRLLLGAAPALKQARLSEVLDELVRGRDRVLRLFCQVAILQVLEQVIRGVSNHKLQGYVNEYAFRQSHRHDEQPMFFTVLHRMIHPETAQLAQAP